jgi:hypothetical protein
MYRDRDNNVSGASHPSPTDSVIVTRGNKDMRRRLGTEIRLQVALRYSHVDFNQEFRGRQYDVCVDDWLSKYEYAAANFAKTFAWGGWIREADIFLLMMKMWRSSHQQMEDPIIPILEWGALS